MAKKAEKLKTTKRFGARYGPRLKLKRDKIEQIQRKPQKCPYCLYKKVRRLTMGIWHCHKCKATFTGRAYTLEKTVFEGEAEETQEVPAEKREE